MGDMTPASLAASSRMGRRLTGPHAAVWKYDLLSALSVHALSSGVTHRTTVLRLIAAITARYDWQRDEMSIGREALATLWNVSMPTVKRELQRLKGLGFLVVSRPGVRGRVAAYRLGRAAIEDATAAAWPRIGADFVARMTGPATPGNVVAFPGPPPDPEGEAEEPIGARWAAALKVAQPGAFRAWFSAVQARREGRDVIFTAPSAFVAHHIETHFPADLLHAARYQWPDCASIRVEVVP